MSKRKEAKQLWQYRKTMRRATDAELRRAKSELEAELLATKRRSQMIALEKRIEAIEDIQAARGIFGKPLQRLEHMSGRKRAKVARAAAKAERKDAAAALLAEQKERAAAVKAERKAAARAKRKEKAAARKAARIERRQAAKEERQDA